MIPKTLKSAALSGNINATRYFLENGVNPSQRVSSGTLLQFVIRHNFTDIAILLMQYGAEINTQDKFGDTPLHEAVKNGNNLLVEELVSRSANIFLKNMDDKTAGYLAAELSYYKIAQILHPGFQASLISKPFTFFKSDQYIIKNAEKVTIEIDPSFTTETGVSRQRRSS